MAGNVIADRTDLIKRTSLGICELPPVPSIGEVAQVSTGGAHAVVLLKDGTVKTWGANTFGQLGDGTTTTKAAAVAVSGLAGAGMVASGNADSLATTQTPPTVSTSPASALTQTTATLNGTVNPNGGVVTNCRFEYGTSTSYGLSAPCTGSGSTPVTVSAQISNLQPNTTYHFRLVATNAGGSGYGQDAELRTLPEPPTVVTGAASLIAQTGATLNGTVNPNGGNVSECHFEYGTTTSYGSSAPCTASSGSGGSPVAVSAQIDSLQPNTAYHFRLVASNAGGSGHGEDAELRTLPPPPTVVTGAASSITQTGATLNGTVNPNGGSVSDCHFEYGTSTSYGLIVPCTSSPGSGSAAVPVSAQIGNLQPNTIYHFRLVASNAGGTGYGADGEFAHCHCRRRLSHSRQQTPQTQRQRSMRP